MQVISVNQYASGLSRLVAYLIDHLIISVVFSIAFWGWWWQPFSWDGSEFALNLHTWGHRIIYGLLLLVYYAFMESSPYQATVGKMALGLRVVDQNNQRITLGRAVLRNISKYLSYAILWIGYIMIIFDDRKQGLHDKIADTFIVRY